MRIETDLDGAVVAAIERHYSHAKEKHPYFCDTLLYPKWSRDELVTKLNVDRLNLLEASHNGTMSMPHVLSCEVSEMVLDIFDKKAHAVEEAYDCIAVLLRVIDVLEGRQSLGRPKEGGAKHGKA